jgi:phosphohistidine phosphatase
MLMQASMPENAPSIILWRHAKSDWRDAGLADHERPLNARGLRDRNIMGAYIAERFKPDIILCSTARRAQETLAAYPLRGETKIVDIEALYHGAPETLLSCARQYGPGHACLMLVGHNPGMEMLAESMRLTAPAIAARFADKYATCGVARLHWPSDRGPKNSGPKNSGPNEWSDIAPSNGAVTHYQAPKLLTPK